MPGKYPSRTGSRSGSERARSPATPDPRASRSAGRSEAFVPPPLIPLAARTLPLTARGAALLIPGLDLLALGWLLYEGYEWYQRNFMHSPTTAVGPCWGPEQYGPNIHSGADFCGEMGSALYPVGTDPNTVLTAGMNDGGTYYRYAFHTKIGPPAFGDPNLFELKQTSDYITDKTSPVPGYSPSTLPPDVFDPPARPAAFPLVFPWSVPIMQPGFPTQRLPQGVPGELRSDPFPQGLKIVSPEPYRFGDADLFPENDWTTPWREEVPPSPPLWAVPPLPLSDDNPLPFGWPWEQPKREDDPQGAPARRPKLDYPIDLYPEEYPDENPTLGFPSVDPTGIATGLIDAGIPLSVVFPPAGPAEFVPSFHENAPPGRDKVELKIKMRMTEFGTGRSVSPGRAFIRLFNVITEARDVSNALYWALPKKKTKKGKLIPKYPAYNDWQRFKAVVDHHDEVDVVKAINNLVNANMGDVVAGAQGQASARGQQSWDMMTHQNFSDQMPSMGTRQNHVQNWGLDTLKMFKGG